MGLDPPSLVSLSLLLHKLSQTGSPRLLLALRPQDSLPDWITHIIFLGPGSLVLKQGPRNLVLEWLANSGMKDVGTNQTYSPTSTLKSEYTTLKTSSPNPEENRFEHEQLSRDGIPLTDKDASKTAHNGEPLVEMENIQIKYHGKRVLGGWTEFVDGREREGLWWTVRRGERWGIFGPNGDLMKYKNPCIRIFTEF